MKKSTSLLLIVFIFSMMLNAQDWSNIPIPADAGEGKVWELQDNVSDDFNYTKSFGSGAYANKTNFGSGKWYNFYHNAWDGPGYTYWNNSQVSVDGDNLVITAGYTSSNSKGGSYGVASGCVTSNNKVKYPVYIEASLSVANISLASCFWLLSPDDTEEIDIIENYGGVNWYKNFTHISHHSFVRSPFTDYQPRDWNSWYPIAEVTDAGGWGEYCWNGGNRKYMRMGVNWIGPKHWEYYIDGELVRVMYYNAMATKIDGTWQYTYYNSVTQDSNGYSMPTNNSSGYSDVTTHTTSASYSLATLKAASNASKGYSVIDPGWFQGGDGSDVDGNGVTNEPKGFTKELEIIINIESQSWLTGSTPSASDLGNASKNQMKVDWVRAYKPVNDGGGSSGGTGEVITIQAESFTNTGGTFNDGYVSYGVNKGGTIINYVNKEDWAEYTVSIPSDGAYEIKYYISSPSTGSTVDFSVSGTKFNTTTVPNNGSWSNFQALTASKTANFTAGNHLIRLTAGGPNWAWNLDKFTLQRVSDLKVATASSLTEQEAELSIYPNPAQNQVNIKVKDPINASVFVELVSIGGIRQIVEQIPTNSTYQLNISSLPKGIYLIKVGNNAQQRLVVK
ncbi:T9SS type A sorting domain-containing protein [Saccharicrinis aurantiacus]|uniref:T9SS type A sorting domain-containing protein n=1 Tax=Saccharicrinis aurantiacus TaxID=1849719 RepID=UPI002493A445|nr:T9SS type A sorting domain-containing protein [Saccharicrinis aurantiacus]